MIPAEPAATAGRRFPRQVRIVHLSAPVFRALADGDLAAANAASPVPLSAYFAGPAWRGVWRRRAEQVGQDPASAVWVTGVIWDEQQQVAVGRAGYHGLPDRLGMVEIGYAVDPAYRRRGYARAALEALLRRAAREPRVKTVRVTISPDNAASCALALQYGFAEVGEQQDEEDGREIIYEVAAAHATVPYKTTTIATERGRLTALRAAALFDGTSSALIPDPLVLIDGDTITAVRFGVPAPADADVTDLGGATLLPGLVDSHTHLAFDASPDPVGRLADRDNGEVIEAMTRAAQIALRGGVTTVRDLGDRGYLSLGLRGRPGLPAIAAAGPPITTPGGHCHYLGGVTDPTVTAIRAAVREHAERGVDVIKVMASGGNLTPGTRQELAQFPPEVLRAAVDEAHRHGLEVTAHAHAATAIADAVAAGADMLEHVSFWTADGVDAPAGLIQLIAERQTVVGLTIGVLPVPGLSPFQQVRARMPAILANIRRMHEAGVLIVASSDAGVAPLKPHDVVRYAPAILRDVGFSPAEALRAVTSLPAAVLGLGHRKGQLAPGFDADILAVDGNPLTDAAALHQIRAVYARGTAVPDIARG